MTSLKDAWHLIKPFWNSKERWSAWGFGLAILVLNILSVYIMVLFNAWNQLFFNALQELNKTAFIDQIIHFSWIAAALISVILAKFYCLQYLHIRWQRWLVEEFLASWLKDQAYYKMQMIKDPTDNPDQRISDDIGSFVQLTLSLSEGLFNSVLTLSSFSFILWNLSGSLPIFGKFYIPGYLCWAALFYAGGGTYLMLKVGHPLIRLNFEQEKFVANFRYSLVRLRENSESIAAYKGEVQESKEFLHRFNSVVQNFYKIIRRSIYINSWSAFYSNLDKIFPILMMAPRFFRGEIKFGVLMQVSQAFSIVRESLSFIVNSYFQIASWQAVVWRLISFQKNLEEIYKLTKVSYADIQFQKTKHTGKITLNIQDILLPSGDLLLKNIQETFKQGENVLISGPSGVGKSTLLRVISGIWPFGHGRIDIPEGEKSLFISQRAYMPLGCLKTVLAYPFTVSDLPLDFDFSKILDLCSLSHLEPQLNAVEDWTRILSGGEQQRISFARALILKPKWLFLDEATSAMDENLEKKLYTLLKSQSPDITFVSIGHRPTLRNFHEREIVLKSPF